MGVKLTGEVDSLNSGAAMRQFEEVDQLKAKLDAHRPIPPEVFQTIAEKLRIDWTYNTTKIEGGPLTYRETAFFVRTGLTSKGRPLEAYLEYRGHLEALEYLEGLVRDKEMLSERVIKEFHSLLLRGIDWVEVVNEQGQKVRKRLHPGSYKRENNHVVKLDGNIHRFCEHTQVPGEMERLIALYEENREELHPVELASEIHHRLVAIHPFADGNGRVARLVMNLILMQAGYVPAVIREEDREEYYTALEAADDGNIEPLLAIAEREVTRTLRLMLDVVEGRTALNEEDLSKKLETFSRQVKGLSDERKDIDQERKTCIASIGDYLYSKATQLIEKKKSDELSLVIRSNDQLYITGGRVSNVHNLLAHLNIIPVKSAGARGFHIDIESTNEYVPDSHLWFHAFSSPQGVHVVSMYRIGRIDSRTKREVSVPAEDLKNFQILNGTANYDDWVLDEIDDLFVNAFNNFLNGVWEETEKRRQAGIN